MGCFSSKITERAEPEPIDFGTLADRTPFSRYEIEALFELYKKLSHTVVRDGYIHKEDLKFALFRNGNKENLFADRIFEVFDLKQNGRIDFWEFIHSLSIFHPKTPVSVKTKYAFKLYDLRHTGFIEREELKEMVLALLNESDLQLSEDIVEAIVGKTFSEADKKGDGRIDEEEWEEYVARNPSLLRHMTLPYLADISLAFPSFVVRSEAEESQL